VVVDDDMGDQRIAALAVMKLTDDVVERPISKGPA